MATILDTNNIFEYLSDRNYCNLTDRDASKVTAIPAKNFNLLINFADDKNLLIKQEPHDCDGETYGEFLAAWQIQQLVKSFPEFGRKIENSVPELLHFDPENSILIVKYLADYGDLYDYYMEQNQFPIEIARSIGQLLATIHSQTFQHTEYQDFLANFSASTPAADLAVESQSQSLNTEQKEDHNLDSISSNSQSKGYANQVIRRLSRITPQVFEEVPQECLQFFKLYQRFPDLARSIADLSDSITPSCLVHNDLKINNILLDSNWKLPGSKVIRSIDWERAGWGDPAFDLGCILGSYLEIWLDGLVINNTLSINESLQLATTPLESIQPSLFGLVESYLDGFPEIVASRPDYLDRAIQFAGLSLIHRVEIIIQVDRIFGNHEIILLQVAKQLLCTPQAAMKTLFGNKFDQLVNR
jgi:Phosphotransferase enzyme family